LDSKEFVPSTKMLALMEHVKQMKADDKAVVFSQFLGMLDLLEHDLKKHKIRFVVMYLVILEDGGFNASKVKSQNYF
jgi:SNF2 family DNA or RNA helicase